MQSERGKKNCSGTYNTRNTTNEGKKCNEYIIYTCMDVYEIDIKEKCWCLKSRASITVN